MTEDLKAVVANLESSYQFAEKGIVSKTLHESSSVKVVLMCFEPGQGLSEHTAPFEAIIQIMKGSADFRLGDEMKDAKPGDLYVMPAGLKHAVTAKERFAFLLTMVRTSAPVSLKT